MFIEIQKKRGKKFFYLAHSFRHKGRIRKIRKYLGVNLSKEKIEELRLQADRAISFEIESLKGIRDPFKTVLSHDEIELIDSLISASFIRIDHLSDEDWMHFTEQFTFNTNAIEGSTVTIGETAEILERDKWPSERSKEEIAETYGVAGAVSYIRKTKTHISLDLIKKLHKITFKNSKGFAGALRARGVEVVITDGRGNIIHRGAPAHKIEELLKELIVWYKANKKRYHSIVLAAVVHNQFENIHPFQDGNGRVGRLLLNNILLKADMPPVNIELKNRQKYYQAIQAYENKGNLRPTIELIIQEYKNLKKQLEKGG
ncbi:MAG: Fic family protein [Candidatus Altiarchaeota archaeon]